MTAEDWVEKTRRFLTRDLWRFDVSTRGWWSAAIGTLQFGVMISEAFFRHQLTMRAAALTYMTTLSLIPLLALALSIVQALGITENLAQLAVDQLLGAVPEEARAEILARVQTADLGGLGTLGSSILFITTVLALQNVEATLNNIWGVVQSRSWVRRFPDYLAVLIVIPLFTGLALSMSTAFRSNSAVEWLLEFELFALLYHQGLQHAPTLFFCLGFSFLYWFFPNTRVNVFSALLGGLVAALLFGIAQDAFTGSIVGSARYSVLFGGMAAIPLTLLWIYISWALVLLGAEVSYAHQNLAHYRREIRGADARPAEREVLALCSVHEIGRAFRDGTPPPTPSDLADRLEAPMREVRAILRDLDDAGIVSPCAAEDRETPYQLGRPAERISMLDVIIAVRGTADVTLDRARAVGQEAVAATMIALEDVVRGAASGRTLADLLDGVGTSKATPSA